MKVLNYVYIFITSIIGIVAIFMVSKTIMDNANTKIHDFDNSTGVGIAEKSPNFNISVDLFAKSTEIYVIKSSRGNKSMIEEENQHTTISSRISLDFENVLSLCKSRKQEYTKKIKRVFLRSRRVCPDIENLSWDRNHILNCTNFFFLQNDPKDSKKTSDMTYSRPENKICSEIADIEVENKNIFDIDSYKNTAIYIIPSTGNIEDEVFKIEFGETPKKVFYYFYNFQEDDCKLNSIDKNPRSLVNKVCDSFICSEYKWEYDLELKIDHLTVKIGGKDYFFSKNYFDSLSTHFKGDKLRKDYNITLKLSEQEEIELYLGLRNKVNEFLDLEKMKIKPPYNVIAENKLGNIESFFKDLVNTFSSVYNCYEDLSILKLSQNLYFNETTDQLFKVLILYCDFIRKKDKNYKHELGKNFIIKPCIKESSSLAINFINDIFKHNTENYDLFNYISNNISSSRSFLDGRQSMASIDSVNNKSLFIKEIIENPKLVIYSKRVKNGVLVKINRNNRHK